MQTTKLISELEREIQLTEGRLAALKEAHGGLMALKQLSNGKWQGDKVPKNTGTGTTKATTKGRKRPKQVMLPCPDCRKQVRKGAGMSQHRISAHGWSKDLGIDVNTEPMPAAIVNTA